MDLLFMSKANKRNLSLRIHPVRFVITTYHDSKARSSLFTSVCS